MSWGFMAFCGPAPAYRMKARAVLVSGFRTKFDANASLQGKVPELDLGAFAWFDS